MTKTHKPKALRRLSQFTVSCLFVLLAGCGLAMDNSDRLERAEAAYEAGDFAAAIIDAKNVLRDEPNEARARLLLGRSSVRVNDAATAEVELRRAESLGVPVQEVAADLAQALLLQGKFQDAIEISVSIDPLNESDQIALQIVRGNAHLGLGEPELAREVFSSVLDSDPNNLDALIGSAMSYLREDNALQALSMLDVIVESNPGSARAWVFSGRVKTLAGQLPAGQADYESGLQLATAGDNIGERRQALAGLVENLLRQEKVGAARDAADQLESIAAGDLISLMLSAQVAYAENDWGLAQQKLQQILSLSDYLPARILLGAVHLETGNFAQAENYLASAVADAPENIRARQLLAEARLRLGRFLEAGTALEPVVAGATATSRSLQLAAAASLDQSEIDQAIGYLETGLARDPGNVGLQLQLAATLIAAEKYAEADQLLETIDTEGSDEAQYRSDAIRVLLLLRSSDPESATVAARNLVEDWPSQAGAHNLLGRVLMARQNFTAARDSFAMAVELDAGDIDSYRFLAAIDGRAGNFEEAKKSYLKVTSLRPEADWALVGLALLANASDDRQGSEDWLRKALAVNPGNEIAASALAGLALQSRKLDEAEKIIKSALRASPGSSRLSNILGTIQFERRDYAVAAESFRTAVDADQSNVTYLINLAMAESQNGNTAEAMRLFEGAGDDVFGRVNAAVTFATLKAGAGDFDGAFEIAEDLIARHPNSSTPIALEAELYAMQGDLGRAASAYDRALSINETAGTVVRTYQLKRGNSDPNARQTLVDYLNRNPNDTSVRLVLAESWGRDDKLAESIREYERVVEADPANGAALNNLAWSYSLVHDSRAEETARRAYSALPGNGAVADTLGWILVQNGKVDEGLDILERAVQLAPTNGEIRYHLGAAFARIGKNDRAVRELEQALKSRLSDESRGAVTHLLADLR